jgi:hypothetical protein
LRRRDEHGADPVEETIETREGRSSVVHLDRNTVVARQRVADDLDRLARKFVRLADMSIASANLPTFLNAWNAMQQERGRDFVRGRLTG